MSKRKILILATALCMVAILAVGGTLAYFTDTDTADNTFTMGRVDIELKEDYIQDSELFPGMDINKDVFVANVGPNPAYVRVHIAIPADMDDGNPNFAAVNNFLHFNFEKDSVADGRWSWIPTMTTGTGYKGNGAGNWNYYTANIDGMNYGVYVVTYRTILGPGETTPTAALSKVYLDKSVDAKLSEDGKSIVYIDDKGNEAILPIGENGKVKFDIKVFAEGTQTATFTDAYDALNTAFGTPGSTGYVNPWARKAAENAK